MGAYLWRIRPIAFLATRLRYERIEHARDDEDHEDEDDDDVGACEGEDVEGIVAHGDEGRVGEGEDDGEDRGGEVAKDDLGHWISDLLESRPSSSGRTTYRPDPRDVPVPRPWRRDGDVEVPSELIALRSD